MGKIFQLKAKLIYNKIVSGRYLHLAVAAPRIASLAKPGQFIEIRASDGLEPFLRRPFGIHAVRDGQIEILYEIIGKGTEALFRRKPGEVLDVIGPLGNGFDYRVPEPQSPRVPVLVAGGMGVAPLTFLAEKLVHSPQSTVHRKVLVLLGARTKSEILCERDFKNLGCEVKVSTDDGSKGFKGYVSELLNKTLSTMDHRLSTIYSCGPKPMLKEIAKISKNYNIPAQISLEEHMACGIGACLGCVVNTKDGYQRVCKEGPVFDAKEIIW